MRRFVRKCHLPSIQRTSLLEDSFRVNLHLTAKKVERATNIVHTVRQTARLLIVKTELIFPQVAFWV